MNLTEAFNVALPELPIKSAAATGPPRLDPRVVTREHIEEEGVPTVFAHIPGSGEYFRFTPDNWAMIACFDCEQGWEELLDKIYERTGFSLDLEWIKQYAADMEITNFWYKAPQEKNIELMKKLSRERRYKVKRESKFSNLADIRFPAWDPDSYLTRLERYIRFVYSPWFTGLTLCLFAFMLYVFITGWSEIGNDTLAFYNFTKKGFADIAEFWLLFFVLVFCHETAHGVTCKHFGGSVRQMGFNLLYLSPCFYVDTSELWVYASRWQRVMGIIAGLWVEMIFCSCSTVVWWATAPGTFAHEFAYKVMLITGIGAVIISLNPLIKLDGYYLLTEIIRMPNLKEESTALVMGWVKRHIFGLPVEVPFVPRRRRWIYVPYAILSGAYSYLLLFAVARFVRNVLYNYSPEWAFLPAAFVAYTIFKSRIRTFLRFMKTVYLDKRERLRAWFTPAHTVTVAAIVAVLLLAPVWRDGIEARFILEPAQRAVLRAEVPGTVTGIEADEGQSVTAGATVAQMRNLELESKAADARATLQLATAKASEAQLRYASFGPAEQERRSAETSARAAFDELSRLKVASPISGVVVTPRVHDLVGRRLEAGSEIAEIADTSTMRARAYVSEFDMRRLRPGGDARLFFDSLGSAASSSVASVGQVSTEIEPGLIHKQEFKGMSPPRYYVADLMVPNPGGKLSIGMTGTVKIYADKTFSERRSLGGFIFRFVRDSVARKIW